MSVSSHRVRLHVETNGEGPCVVLAHGFGGSARNFRPQSRALSRTYRVVLYDCRGHARSEAPRAPADYDFERLVDDFESVAQDCAQPIVAGGLSLGAATALGFALRRPDRVRALVLASPPGGSDDPNRRRWALEFAQAIDERGLEAAGSDFVWGERARFDPRGAALIRSGLMEHQPPALAHLLRQTLAELPGPTRLEPALGRFERPTLVIVGSEDASALEPGRALASMLPNAELAIVPGAGHVVNLVAADAFNELCQRFLSRVDRRDGRSGEP